MTNIYWQCSCGESFLKPYAAFLHRDGSSHHHVTPIKMTTEIPRTDETKEYTYGPDPTVEEVRMVMRELWAPPEAEEIRQMLWSGRGWVEGAIYED